MFTKYKGIAVPQNYSGSRFKSEPPKTEMKTHRPAAVYTPTKTSISPTFERVVSQGYQGSLDNTTEEKIVDNVSDFNNFVEQDTPLENDYLYNDTSQDNAQEREQQSVQEDSLKNEQESVQECEPLKKGSGLFDELSPLINSFFKNISSEDLLLLSLIVLLFSEGNEESNDLIIPLLCLFLYR